MSNKNFLNDVGNKFHNVISEVLSRKTLITAKTHIYYNVVSFFYLYTYKMVVSLQDVPKKVQYITVDSQYVKGSNNTFVVDISLESNLHVDEMNKVIGIKMVDFYVTQIGQSDAVGNTNVAKYIDVICPDIPKIAQMLDERKGQVLARVPLERSFTGSNNFIMRDKQWKSFTQALHT